MRVSFQNVNKTNNYTYSLSRLDVFFFVVFVLWFVIATSAVFRLAIAAHEGDKNELNQVKENAEEKQH